jgi:predicted membrane protein
MDHMNDHLDRRIRERAGRRGAYVSQPVLTGLIVIAVGVLLTLNNLGLIEIGEIWRYWPLILVAMGVTRLVQPRHSHGRGLGLFLVLLGGWLLLTNLHVVEWSVRKYWPLMLVFLGLVIIWGALTRSRTHSGEQGDSSPTISAFALLGGVERKSNARDFRGGEISAVMGGCEIDLTQADISGGEAVIDVFAFWGGIEIKVPSDWSVTSQGLPIMGYFGDTTQQPKGETVKRLIVKGMVIMGGMEIKN